MELSLSHVPLFITKRYPRSCRHCFLLGVNVKLSGLVLPCTSLDFVVGALGIIGRVLVLLSLILLNLAKWFIIG